LVLAVAGLTDLLDGWLARKWNIVSLLGKFLDPLADKLLLLVCLVMLMKLGRVDAWLVIILLSRELLITGLRAVAVGEGIVISAGTTGKYKLAFQLVGLAFIMWYGSFLSFSAYQIGVWILYVALVISLYSGFQYLKDFFTELYDKRGYIARKPKQLV
jgi:CDP-diacylglycerol--glycerol-3-phosphate 3-phosphatidyltransferase